MGDGNEIRANKPSLTGYAQVQAGNVRFAGDTNALDIGAKLGGTYNYKNLSIGAFAGFGTTANAGLSANVTIPLNRTTGIDIGGSGRVDCEVKPSTFDSSYVFEKETVVAGTDVIQYTIPEGGTIYRSIKHIDEPGYSVYNSSIENGIRTDEKICLHTYEEETPAPRSTKYNRANFTSEVHAGLKITNQKGNINFGAAAKYHKNINRTEQHYYAETPTLIFAGTDHHFYDNLDFDTKENYEKAKEYFIQNGFNVYDCSDYDNPNSLWVTKYSNNSLSQITQRTHVESSTKPESRLVAGIYASGERNLSKDGRFKLFGNVFVGKNINASGGYTTGECGIRMQLGK